MIKGASLVLVSTFSLFLICGCGTSIRTIRENPGKFSSEVNLSGKVELSFGIPMSGFSVLLFSDATGKVIIFTGKQHKQKENAVIKGKVISFPDNPEYDLKESNIPGIARHLINDQIIPENIADLTTRLIYEMAQNGLPGVKSHFFIAEQ
jgi:hypothetical protein